MTKIAIFSCAHLKSFSAFNNQDAYYKLQTGNIKENCLFTNSSRLSRTLSALEYVFTYCERENIDYIFSLGDLFHEFGKDSIDVKIVARQFFDYICRFYGNIKFLTLVGNHDQPFRAEFHAEKKSDLREVMFNTNNLLPPSIEKLYVDYKKIDDCMFYAVSYLYRSEEVMKAIDYLLHNNPKYGTISHDSKKVLLGHFDIKGCSLTQNYYSESGVDPKVLTAFFDKSFIGHIHKHQVLEDGKVIITGALLPQTFHDVGDNYGFVVVNLDTLDWEFVNVPSGRFIVLEDIKENIEVYPYDTNNFYKIILYKQHSEEILAHIQSKYNVIYEKRILSSKGNQRKNDDLKLKLSGDIYSVDMIDCFLKERLDEINAKKLSVDDIRNILLAFLGELKNNYLR